MCILHRGDKMLHFENQDKARFAGVGEYDIPQIIGVEDVQVKEWIPFNYALTCKEPQEKGVHFFLDDYQFERVWNNIDKYTEVLQRFKAVMSPDFSMFTVNPKALQIYQHFRKHFIGAYWQANGLTVIPTINWADEKSFEWCFDGEPTNSVVAISTVGSMNSKANKEGFYKGYYEMKKQLQPKKVLCYGTVPEEIKNEVQGIGCHWERRFKNGR